MTFNLDALQQIAERTLHNADEFVRKYTDFFVAPPGNTTFQYYDKNGNLVTVTRPNLAKLEKTINDFVANAKSTIQSWWKPSVSVTTSQELLDAINDIPPGGMGVISIPGNTELFLDRDIPIANKTVLITGPAEAHAKIVFEAYQVDESNYDYHRFSLGYLANLRFHYIDFTLGAPPSGLNPKTAGLINAKYAQNSSIVLGVCSIILDGIQHFIESTPYGTPLQIGIYLSNIKTQGSYVIFNTYRPCLLIKNANTIDDNTKWVSSSDHLIS